MHRCEETRKELTDFLPDRTEPDHLPPPLWNHLNKCQACRDWLRHQQEWVNAHKLNVSRFRARQFEWTGTRGERLTESILSQRFSQSGDKVADRSGDGGARRMARAASTRALYPYIAAAAVLLVMIAGYVYLSFGPDGAVTSGPDAAGLPENNGRDVEMTAAEGMAAMEQFLEQSERFLLLVSELEEHWEHTDNISFRMQAEYARRLQNRLSEMIEAYPVERYPLTNDLFQKLQHFYAEAEMMGETVSEEEVAHLVRATSDDALLTRIRLLRVQLADLVSYQKSVEVTS